MALNTRLHSSHKLTLALTFALSLGACGGGTDGLTGTGADTPGATATRVGTLVPGPAMGWATATERPSSIKVLAADGTPARGAAVRVFTLSRGSPQDGSPLGAPVPVSLLDTVVTDGSGRASLALQWPGHLSELLVVATLDDTHGQAVLSADATEGTRLQLGR
jgi:hypothetical protein